MNRLFRHEAKEKRILIRVLVSYFAIYIIRFLLLILCSLHTLQTIKGIVFYTIDFRGKEICDDQWIRFHSSLMQ